MLRNQIYYRLKPIIPASLRRAMRQRFAARIRERTRDIWPVFPGSERAPEGWPGWPNGKRFAVVLTHDVEGQVGLDNCHRLMQLEHEMGFTDRPMLEKLKAKVQQVHDDLLVGLMEGKRK